MINPLLGELDRHMNKNYVTPEGVFTQDELLIGKMINEYSPQLSLVLVASHNPVLGEKSAAVLVTPGVGAPYVLMFIDRHEINWGLYARVFASDMQKAGLPLEDQLKANDMARELYNAAKAEEDAAERADLAKSILKSKLHAYKHNGKVYR